MTTLPNRNSGADRAPHAPAAHIVVVADCDHPSIAIEQRVLDDVCPALEWHACRTEAEIVDRCAYADAILIQYAPMTRAVLARLPRCRIVARYGVGVDTVDLAAAAEFGIVVSNVPDYGTHEVADHALAMMLCLTRKIAYASHLVKRGEWDFRRMQPVRRHGTQTIGIIGIGRIGSALAHRARALGMTVVAHDPYVRADTLPDYVALTGLDALLAQSDVVSVHCPLTDATRNLLDADRLGRMKPGSYLINTARGSIVDEIALEQLLHDGRLAGAAMDVLDREPGAPEHPLFRHENFLCTPHMAWHSDESAQDLKRKAAEEVRRVLRGDAPLYQVNRS